MTVLCFVLAIIFACIGFKTAIFGSDSPGIDGPEITGFFLFAVIFLILGIISLM